METDPWPLPLNFQFGVSTYAFNNESSQLLVSFDGGYKGLFLVDNEEGFAFGAGVKLELTGGSKLRADYSFQDFGRLSNINSFALSIFF